MDFHLLPRRQLQDLRKRNKIPANVTNAAMADSLEALEIVEGINELLQACESETDQASIDSGMRLEIASPLVPPTGGKSTRRRNAKTPVAPRTPALAGFTSQSRRSVKEDTAVKQVFGTRRSARLAEKSARLLKGVADENPDSSKKGLFTDDCHLDGISGVTDVIESTNLEENDEKQGIAAAVEQFPTTQEETSYQSDTENGAQSDLKENSEEKTHTEVAPCEKELVEQDETSNDVETELVGLGSETDSESDEFQPSETDVAVKDHSHLDAIAVIENEVTDAPPVEEAAAAADDVLHPMNVKNVSTPIRTYARNIKKYSDNKENVGNGNGSKTKTRIIVKRSFEVVDEMGQLSTKLKGVYLTPKLDKENKRNEGSATARSALQSLPGNQQVD